MNRCRKCRARLPERARFCSECGAAADGSSSRAPTRVTERTGQVIRMAPGGGGAGLAGAVAPARFPSSDPSDVPRYTAGSMLGDRYRIVGLLGRGGMGEVYRADDLTLGQPVALKLLPEHLTHDKARLQRLLGEVRIARQISHPNVCRVYDISEVDGLHYFSMEFVDGEDLGTLLSRIGRFSDDKAVQLARQICAGLAAAHERGVIHRDLKPANIMIDGRGKVRITDFGLAAPTGEVSGAEVRAGTPAYMSPEQLRGDDVTVRSDLYALGLVLYELFTGTPVGEGAPSGSTAARNVISSVTSSVTQEPGMDPAVERVILRCLEEKPEHRPASAIAVAAALPGGDPLAAALAAGETPSPEMVAAAGEAGTLSPKTAAGLFLGIIAGLLMLLVLFEPANLTSHVPMPKSGEVLADRAQEIVGQLGYDRTPLDVAYGFSLDLKLLKYIDENDWSLDRWDRLATDNAPAISLWYRQSPRHMVSESSFSIINPDDPPLTTQGMIRLILDSEGRLGRFEAVPPVVAGPAEGVEEPEWDRLFDLAGLDMAGFRPVTPEWTPAVAADVQRAWEMPHPDWPGEKLRVEAAAYRGKPVSFRTIQPWIEPEEMGKAEVTWPERINEVFTFVLIVIPMAVGLFLAKRNITLGRSDLQGAFKLSLGFLVIHTIVWAMWTDHVPNFITELQIFEEAVGFNLFLAASLWVAYVALEPYLRRYWPDTLISWSRVLTGRYRDPLVGRDILIGCMAGVVMALFAAVGHLFPSFFGLPTGPPGELDPDTLRGLHVSLGALLDGPMHGLFYTMMVLFLIFLLKLAVRKAWIAAAITIAFFTQPVFFVAEDYWPFALLFVLPATTISILNLLRFGVVSSAVATTVFLLTVSFPMTTDFSAWYAGSTLLILGGCAALAIYGFRIAVAGRPILAHAARRPETA